MRFSFASPALAAVLAALAVPADALLYNVSLNSQVRMAYAGTTGMTISWNTYHQLGKPTVRYGFAPDALVYSASSGVSITYPTSLTYNNHVPITGLKPDTLYYYMPEDLLLDEFTRPPYAFKTGRVAGDSTPYSVAVVIDMGLFGPEGLSTTAAPGVAASNILKPGEQTTIASLAKAQGTYDFVMHPGDIAYADTWLKESLTGFLNVSIADGYKAYESILDGFYDELTPVTTGKPYMVSPGNHEANCDNGGTGNYTYSICMPGQLNFTGYRNHFRMPSEQSGGVGNFWYSYDNGMVHYIHIDTETDFGTNLTGPSESVKSNNAGPFGAPNQQISWLEADLKAVDRSKTPWVVVGGHRPWYSSGSICANCSKAFEPLFLKYGVDLYISGHFHVYERMTPIGKNGTVDPNGLHNPSSPWYIVNGAAGHYDGLDPFVLPFAPYHRFGLDTANGVYGWSRITYHNCTHLTQEFIASSNGSVLDSATLYKNRTCPGLLPPVGGSSSSSSASRTGTKTSTASAPLLTTSTVLTTIVSTVTQCPSTVTNCPAGSTVLVTKTVPLYTTVCPVSVPVSVPGFSSAPSPSSPSSVPASTKSSVVSVVTVTAAKSSSSSSSSSSTPAVVSAPSSPAVTTLVVPTTRSSTAAASASSTGPVRAGAAKVAGAAGLGGVVAAVGFALMV